MTAAHSSPPKSSTPGDDREHGDAQALSALDCELALGVGHVARVYSGAAR